MRICLSRVLPYSFLVVPLTILDFCVAPVFSDHLVLDFWYLICVLKLHTFPHWRAGLFTILQFSKIHSFPCHTIGENDLFQNCSTRCYFCLGWVGTWVALLLRVNPLDDCIPWKAETNCFFPSGHLLSIKYPCRRKKVFRDHL